MGGLDPGGSCGHAVGEQREMGSRMDRTCMSQRFEVEAGP